MRLLDLFRRKRSTSLLREITDETAFAQNPAAAVLDAALLVRRAGLEHLVTEATRAEVMALGEAGEFIARERVLQLLVALRKPGAALKEFDGGATLRRETLDEAEALARKEGG